MTLTSIQASSPSSLDLLPPLTACRLLGGAMSSELFRAGRLRSSILTTVEGGAVVGEVDKGIRNVVRCGYESCLNVGKGEMIKRDAKSRRAINTGQAKKEGRRR